MAAAGAILLLYDDLADAFSIAAACDESVRSWVGREVEDGDSTPFATCWNAVLSSLFRHSPLRWSRWRWSRGS
jgi:hypothetical protein